MKKFTIGTTLSWIHSSHLAHPLVSIIVTTPFAVAGMAWLGAIIAVVYYYGREVRDGEVAAGTNFTRDLKTKSGLGWLFKGYWPGNWTKDGRLDFFPVVAVCVAMVALEAFLK